MNLAQLKQLYPQLANVDPRILNSLTGKKAQAPGYFTYGADSAGGTNLSMQGQGGLPGPGYPSQAADTKGLETKFAAPQSVNPNYNALSSAGLNLVNTGNLGYKDGGNVHIPQFKTGTTGHFVQGAGDGQSDDIPAMLADGEYVFDADTVAALGNGSSKAGALQLDKMRKSIRKHKRRWLQMETTSIRNSRFICSKYEDKKQFLVSTIDNRRYWTRGVFDFRQGVTPNLWKVK
jgi:hypothetical protein